MRPDYGLSQYCQLLLAYWHIYRVLEEGITGFLARHACDFSYEDRYKLPRLLDDLAFFHVDAVVPQALPESGLRWPEIKTTGQLIGVLYVIEGATLGGQLISRSLAEQHARFHGAGASFFNGYGDDTELLWHRFTAFAETIAADEHACREAELAACKTFDLFEETLDAFGGVVTLNSAVVK